jgi:hypothetical protein
MLWVHRVEGAGCAGGGRPRAPPPRSWGEAQLGMHLPCTPAAVHFICSSSLHHGCLVWLTGLHSILVAKRYNSAVCRVLWQLSSEQLRCMCLLRKQPRNFMPLVPCCAGC